MALDDCALAPKLDPVRERFAQEYHATGNASEALRRANPKAKKWKQHSLHVEASKVLSEPEVSLRLEQLLTSELEAARDGAMGTGQFSAAVSAIGLKAKLHGLIKDKVANEFMGANGEVITPVINVSLSRNKP